MQHHFTSTLNSPYYTGVVARCLNFTVYAILMQLFCVAGLKLGRDAMFFIQPNCPQFKCFLAGNSQRATTPVQAMCLTNKVKRYETIKSKAKKACHFPHLVIFAFFQYCAFFQRRSREGTTSEKFAKQKMVSLKFWMLTIPSVL